VVFPTGKRRLRRGFPRRWGCRTIAWGFRHRRRDTAWRAVAGFGIVDSIRTGRNDNATTSRRRDNSASDIGAGAVIDRHLPGRVHGYAADQEKMSWLADSKAAGMKEGEGQAVSELSDSLPRPANRPCGSCPYRRDVPSGIWHESEYAKLPRYDGETWEQSAALFFCHQKDGHLCAGWLACHDAGHLLALRMSTVDPSVYEYQTDVPVFSSGSEAAAHGMQNLHTPGPLAQRMIKKLARRRPR
jgi:hypothetical protein